MKTLILFSCSAFAHMGGQTLQTSMEACKTGLSIVLCVIPLLTYLPAEALAQAGSQNTDTTTKTDPVIQKFKSLNLSYETGRIVLKDKSIIKKAKLHEIHPYWIVYEKYSSLHDLYIEEIDRIEIDDSRLRVIVFDEKKRPVFKRKVVTHYDNRW